MRAMILAAGEGKRMRPLTDHTPKPLLLVAKQPLITYHLKSFKMAGITEVVINLGYLGEKIENYLGNGTEYGVNIQYSYEDPILETGGGIKKALPLLGKNPFIAVSGDVLTDFDFRKLPKEPMGLAHLVLTDNPPHHLKGDYALINNYIVESGGPLLNFGGIGVYRPELFESCPEGRYPLPLLFKQAIAQGQITGEHFSGLWHNIGTPEQLQTIALQKNILRGRGV